MAKNIAVVFGGKSCENEISVLTGIFVLNVLDRTKYRAIPVYFHTDGKLYSSPEMTELKTFQSENRDFPRVFFDRGALYFYKKGKDKIEKKIEIDALLNCCHGGLGEGGGVSAIAQMSGIPLCSPPVGASGLFMDKSTTKLLAKALKIPTLDYVRIGEEEYKKRSAFLLEQLKKKFSFPLVVKPASLGSSIGIALCKSEDDVKNALSYVFTLDSVAVVEPYLERKRDVNCAAYSLGGVLYISEPEESSSKAGIYSFADKYVEEKKEKSGGEFSPLLRRKIRAYTRALYNRTAMKGIVRMDFLVDGEKAYLGEVNTVPGSLAYYLFCERVSDAKDLFSDLIEDGLKVKAEEKEPIHTGILNAVHLHAKSDGVRV